MSGLQKTQRNESASDHPPISAFAVSIAQGVSAVVFDRSARAAPVDRRERLSLMCGERLVRGPVVSTELETMRGTVRHLALIETAAEQLAGAGVAVFRGDRRIATLDADWLQSPVRTSSALFHDLAHAGRTRLLKLLLANAASLFCIGADRAFVRTVTDLADQTALPKGQAESMCAIGRGVVLTLRLIDEARDTSHPQMAWITPDRAGVLGKASLCREAARGNGRLHVYLPRAPERHSRLIGFCGTATPFSAELSRVRVVPFAEWLRRTSPTARAWGHRRLQASAQSDAMARALGDALASGPQADVQFTLRSVSETPVGVLLAADITDPLCRVRSVVVERDSESAEIAIDTLAGGERIAATTPLCGFFEAPLAGSRAKLARIRLAYRNGRVQTVFEQSVAPFVNAEEAVFARPSAGESLTAALHRAAAAAARAVITQDRPLIAVRVTRFGRSPERRQLTLVAPMPSDPDVLRARSAAVFAESGDGVAFVYHWAAHADDAARMAAIEDVHALSGAPYLAVVTDPRATDAERVQAALRMTSEPVILLGPSVLPFSPGWLRAWLKILTAPSPVSIVGATLLSAHGGVLDAGGRVSVDPAGKFVVTPRTRRPAQTAIDRRRSAPTSWARAAGVGMKPAAVGVFCESKTPLRDPDLLVVETIARLKARGANAVTLLRAPFTDFAAPVRPSSLSAEVDRILLAESLRAIGDPNSHSRFETS